MTREQAAFALVTAIREEGDAADDVALAVVTDYLSAFPVGEARGDAMGNLLFFVGAMFADTLEMVPEAAAWFDRLALEQARRDSRDPGED